MRDEQMASQRLMAGNPIDDKLHEECGIFGVSPGRLRLRRCRRGMRIRPHCLCSTAGREAAGIAVYDGTCICSAKGAGWCQRCSPTRSLLEMPGGSGIGHVLQRCGCGEGLADLPAAIQPFVFRFVGGMMAVA